MKYYLYILVSRKSYKTYVGCTNNLNRRLSEHNSGKSVYTRKFKPWEIAYTEEFDDNLDARRREKYYKSAAGRIKLKRILNDLYPRSSVDRAEVS